ncbi:hypothetical protein [Streptococcus ovis]|uniref:hypothetical protein n=1 Tax=Streptococcus ovis TaxID=82806 RepID=UPI0003731D38|nr:hypothetical protein [Streptococcus ovis]
MAEVIEYKCPNCGGAIAFDSRIQKMKCPYCDSELEMESLKHLDEQLQDLPASKELTLEEQKENQWEGTDEEPMNLYVCESCGGQLVADENTAATSCPYCDNPIVLKERLAGALRPDVVIPFKLDKKAAKAALSKHLVGKRLLPTVFKDENHIDEVKGLYVPFWIFDADVEADMRYKGTMVRTWSDSNYTYTETNFFSLLRSGTMQFEHIPVDGSSKLDNRLMEALEPFDFSEAVDFQTAYLAGYLADKYDQTSEESISSANTRVKTTTEKMFLGTTSGYLNVIHDEDSIRLHNDEAIYALYPVWLLNTTWQGKKYTFAMNGQTGKFVGDLPLDKSAYWKYFSITGFSVALICFALAWLFYLM